MCDNVLLKRQRETRNLILEQRRERFRRSYLNNRPSRMEKHCSMGMKRQRQTSETREEDHNMLDGNCRVKPCEIRLTKIKNWNCTVKPCEIRLTKIKNSLPSVGDSDSDSDNQPMPPLKETRTITYSRDGNCHVKPCKIRLTRIKNSLPNVGDSDSDSDIQPMPPLKETRTITYSRDGNCHVKPCEIRLTKIKNSLSSVGDSDSDSDNQPMPPLKETRAITYSRDSLPSVGDSDSDSDNQPMPPLKETRTITYSREAMVRDMVPVNDFCLSCGAPETEVDHPLFEGNLCRKCKENFIESLYRYDEDGSQSYCTVCCAGQEVILCDIASCCRCFCKDCVDILVAPETFDKLKDIDPWSCFMCDPTQCHAGHLKPREDWSTKVQQLFYNNSAFFEPHRVYPSIPVHQRRPLRVLSLFDGIATGYLALKQLGFKIERYVASEICEDSIAVGMIKHDGKIEYVGDVCTITNRQLAEWGPFDLLIGGSPCNDLSMVNPWRKGLYGGTGLLFFEFVWILSQLRPREDDDRPFFWLFENVVNMENKVKADICQFLECNPVLIDAVKVSPAHRPRYFWGNLPGMNRATSASLEDMVNLQDCLETGRFARFDKVRTITTTNTTNRQGNMGLPVSWNNKDDSLWCSEIEQVFGLPKHYTDVNNMAKTQRLKVLGRGWSVPVVRHLLAPLKDFYECEAVN